MGKKRDACATQISCSTPHTALVRDMSNCFMKSDYQIRGMPNIIRKYTPGLDLFNRTGFLFDTYKKNYNDLYVKDLNVH